MIRNKFKILTNFSFICLPYFLISQIQNVIGVAGGNGKVQNVQIDWTIGESLTTTLKLNTLQVTQGFHQPSYILTKTNEVSDDFGRILIYPNPFSDNLTIEIDSEKEYNLKLFDSSGKLIQIITLGKGIHTNQLSMSNLPSGMYIFQINNHNQALNYRIFKTK